LTAVREREKALPITKIKANTRMGLLDMVGFVKLGLAQAKSETESFRKIGAFLFVHKLVVFFGKKKSIFGVHNVFNIMNFCRWEFPLVVLSVACDRGLVAVGLVDGNIEIRETISGDRVRGWEAHDHNVIALVFTFDKRLVSASWDGFVKKWAVETGTEVWSRNVGCGWVLGVSELVGGRLVVGGEDMSVRILDGVTGHEVMACRGHAGDVRAVVSLGDGVNAGSFASGSRDHTIRVWASDGTLVRVVEVAEYVLSLSLSPCGHLVAAGCADGSVNLYRLPDWDRVWSVKAHQREVWSVAWSPDGRFFGSGSVDGTAKFISADTGATLRTLRGHTSHVYAVVFSGDGTKVLTGSQDETVRVWRSFWAMERRVRGLMGGLEVGVEDWEMKEVCCEIVGRMKRLWEVEAE
jgi:WD40 repeat protein